MWITRLLNFAQENRKKKFVSVFFVGFVLGCTILLSSRNKVPYTNDFSAYDIAKEEIEISNHDGKLYADEKEPTVIEKQNSTEFAQIKPGKDILEQINLQSSTKLPLKTPNMFVKAQFYDDKIKDSSNTSTTTTTTHTSLQTHPTTSTKMLTTTSITTTTRKVVTLTEPAPVIAMMRELEARGWTTNKIAIGPHIVRMKLNRKPKNITMKKLPKKILATSYRGKITHVGRYRVSAVLIKFKNMQHFGKQTSLQNCTNKCQIAGKPWILFEKNGNCHCVSAIPYIAITAITDNDGDEYGDIYRISIKYSNVNLTHQSVKQESAGCFPMNQNMYKGSFKAMQKKDYNIANCLLQCENSFHTTALWSNTGVCQCGRFTTKFSLGDMGKKVNDTLCDKPCASNLINCESSYVRVIRTNINDDRCSMRKTILPNIGRRVALISFPGSGNTWVRYLLESATGIFTGSVYIDAGLFSKGFLGENLSWNSLRTSAIKTHSPWTARKFAEALIIIRNPYDAMMAEINRVRGGHVGYAEEELFTKNEWLFFILFKIKKWYEVIEHYSKLNKVLVVFYEDIKEDPLREIRKMVNFLNYPVINLEERLVCLESDLSGSFQRKKRILSFDPFLQVSKDLINYYINSARELTREKHLPIIPMYER